MEFGLGCGMRIIVRYLVLLRWHAGRSAGEMDCTVQRSSDSFIRILPKIGL
ncbi:MAG: hypothetical protein R3D97_08190 [Paracoccaceae bacterium]